MRVSAALHLGGSFFLPCGAGRECFRALGLFISLEANVSCSVGVQRVGFCFLLLFLVVFLPREREEDSLLRGFREGVNAALPR